MTARTDRRAVQKDGVRARRGREAGEPREEPIIGRRRGKTICKLKRGEQTGAGAAEVKRRARRAAPAWQRDLQLLALH